MYNKLFLLLLVLFLSACSSDKYYVTDPLQNVPEEIKGIRFALEMKNGQATAMWILDSMKVTSILIGAYQENKSNQRVIIWQKKAGIDYPKWELKDMTFGKDYYSFNLNGATYKLKLKEKSEIEAYIKI